MDHIYDRHIFAMVRRHGTSLFAHDFEGQADNSLLQELFSIVKYSQYCHRKNNHELIYFKTYPFLVGRDSHMKPLYRIKLVLRHNTGNVWTIVTAFPYRKIMLKRQRNPFETRNVIMCPNLICETYQKRQHGCYCFE
jgi:hypothetical protein